MPEHNPQSRGNILLQVTQNHIEAPAIRAFIIPIFDERVRCILRAVYVVHGTDGEQKMGQVCGFHIGQWGHYDHHHRMV